MNLLVLLQNRSQWDVLSLLEKHFLCFETSLISAEYTTTKLFIIINFNDLFHLNGLAPQNAYFARKLRELSNK